MPTVKIWPDTIPKPVLYEAFDLGYELWGQKGVQRFVDAEQSTVIAHSVRMAAAALHIVRQTRGGEASAVRIARNCLVHDIGKPNTPGISDDGVWTQARRLSVRREHPRLGGAWVRTHLAHLADVEALAFAVEHHHNEMPHPNDYRAFESPYPEWCGDLHVLQGLDRTDALTSRPYVLEREGIVTASGAVAMALAADPRGPTGALPPVADFGIWELDLRAGLSEVAQVLVS